MKKLSANILKLFCATALLLPTACLNLSPSIYNEGDSAAFLAAIVGDALHGTLTTTYITGFGPSTSGLESTGDGSWTEFTLSGASNGIVSLAKVGTTFLGVDGVASGVYTSTDRGRTWTVGSDLVGTDKLLKIAACGNNVMVAFLNGNTDPASRFSSDGGATWGSITSISTGSGAVTDLDCNSTHFIVIQSNSKSMRRFDVTGSSWVVHTTAGFGATAGNTIAVNSANVLAWYQTATNAEIYYSTDNSDTLTSYLDTGAGPTSSVAGYGNSVYFTAEYWSGSNECRFRRSTDGTTGWSTLAQTITCSNTHTFDSVSILSSGVFLAAGSENTGSLVRKVYRSTDSGQTWAADSSLPGSGTVINDFVTLDESVVY